MFGFFRIAIPSACLALLFISCVTIEQGGKLEDFAGEIERLQSALELNPANADAQRRLGVIHFRVGDYAKASEYLRKALVSNEKDAEARFYFGMTLESLDDTDGALAVYVNYTDYSLLSPYRRLMEGRFRALSRDIIRRQFRDIVASELQLTDRDADPDVIAVFPLRHVGIGDRYKSLGFGLAELIISDLGQIQRLRLVERIRIDELLDELQLSQSAGFDPTTTARLGKLLKAGNVIGGTFSVSEEQFLRTDVASRKITEASPAEPFVRTDDLSRFFRLQKTLVFDLLTRLGVEPTPIEKERIDRIPTENVIAFILFSIGLERESERDFIAARSFFREAVNADPNFALARRKMDAMDALVVAGKREDAMNAAFALDPDPAVIPKRPLVDSRINVLLLQAGFDPYPGGDGRVSPADAQRVFAPILPLQRPPNPPVTK